MSETRESKSGRSGKTVLCLSGGGMRSAAFCIGVLEALRKETQGKSEFDYLSTVSGGGFAGAWYWVKFGKGRAEDGSEDETDDAATFDTEVKKLRRHGGYLDAENWKRCCGSFELAVTYVSKLVLFWVFAIPAVWTALLLAAWIGHEASRPIRPVLGAISQQPVLGLLAAVPVITALQFDRGRFVVFLGGFVAALVVAGYGLVFWIPEGETLKGADVVAAVVGAFASAAGLAAAGRSSFLVRLVAKGLGTARLVNLAGWLCLALLVVVSAWLLQICLPIFEFWFGATACWPYIGALPKPLALTLLTGGIALLAGCMKADWVSLGRVYRNRIRDGFELGEDTNLKSPDGESDEPQKPQLLINAAANIDEKLHREWDERKAAHFAWTPEEYIDRRPESPDHGEYGGIELKLAVATSAAVAGPRMGSYTARPIGLLLSFFNVRLGQWFVTPRNASEAFRPQGLLLGLACVEVFPGFFRKEPEWIHLTDGGHFDNLGLYEAVRRKCRFIVVVDGSCDPDYRFSDLANAIRKIRIDQEQTEIEIDGLRWTEDGSALKDPSGKRRHLKHIYGGTVRYPHGPPGEIVYVKPALIGDEPADVAGYADIHPKFPHESTADQWFSESQFESYQRLGEYTIRSSLQHYQNAKLTRGQQKSRSVRRIVSELREAAMIAGRPELRPTHGGTIICRDLSAADPMKFLLVKDTEGGTWVLPKGHIEHGENPVSCAKREFEEETPYSWPDEGKEPVGVVFDKFKKGEEEVRCRYCIVYVRHELKRRNKESQNEDRPSLWITPGEYENALRTHPSTAKEMKKRPEPDPALCSKESLEKLAASKMLLPDLLWILQEAERQVYDSPHTRMVRVATESNY